MAYSRLGRLEEKRQTRRLILSLAGIFVVVLFLFIFGIRMLTGFSVLVENLRPSGPSQQASDSQQILLPPVLNSLPEATNSAMVSLTVRGTSATTIIVYLNEEEYTRETVADDEVVEFHNIKAKEGINTISSKAIGADENASDLSNILTFTVDTRPPLLEVTKPEDGTQIRGESNTVEVSGKTEEDNRMTVNDRFMIVARDGTFTHQYPLTEGNNTLAIIATDPAGNTTTIERSVVYLR